LSSLASTSTAHGTWSDGNIAPNKNTRYMFKVLPVAFLVARNIKIENSQWQSSMSSLAGSISSSSSSYSSSNSQRASVGPFFIGSSNSASASSSASGGRSYAESSTFTSASGSSAGTLAIKGPQIVGWLCSPMPAFPTATADEVVAFEDAQLAKYTKKQAALSTTSTVSQKLL
jgi:hypothetical protein